MESPIVRRYAQELFKWIQTAKRPSDVPLYFQTFCLNMSQFHRNGLQISSDERVVQSILLLFDTLKFQSFDRLKYICRHRLVLRAIATQLLSRNYISRRHLLSIDQKSEQCLVEQRVWPFLRRMDEMQQKRQEQIRSAWNECIRFQVINFWFWIVECNIRHPTVSYLFEYTQLMNEDLPQILQNSQLFHNLRKQLRQQAQMLNTNQTQCLTQSISQKRDINQILTQMAVQSSLFLNQSHNATLSAIKTFIKYLNHTLFPQKHQYFDIFGSIRSRTALIQDFDIDITVIFIHQRKIDYNYSLKFNDMRFLQSLKQKILLQQPQWLQSCYSGKPTAPFAYLKLTIIPQVFQRKHNIANLTKIDITVDGKYTIINSQFISKFTQNKQILIFCLLIKQWAKSAAVINPLRPMESLSGYGIMLMSIYFLMYTKQIDFLTDPNNVKVQRCQMKDLYQNLCGFLQFYGEKGQFKQKRMIVCLLKNARHRCPYDEQLVINMYDHLQNTNPGRMTIDSQQQLYLKLSKALQILQLKNEQAILQLFTHSKHL